MALFRRNKVDQATIPAELQNYYQAEKRERTGVAWLLALGTLIATILVILGLFFGGRWIYRKAHHPKTQTAGTQEIKTESDTDHEASDSENSGSSNSSTSDDSNGSRSSSSSNNAPQTSSTRTTTPSSRSNAANNASDLPNTGPGDTLAVFAAVSLMAYVIHRRFLAD